MLSLYAWALIFLVPVCVLAETHRFLAIPQAKQKVALSSDLTINCTTNDANATTDVYFQPLSRRPGRRQNSNWRKLSSSSDSIVKVKPQVYMLRNVTRQDSGKFQCRAWQKVNGTNNEITGPLYAVRVMAIKGKKPVAHKTKLTAKKKNKGKKGNKKPGNKRRGDKKPGNKKTGHKKNGKNKPGKKRKPNPTKKWKKRRPGSKKGATNKNKPKKHGQKKKIVQVSLKAPRTNVLASEGKNITLNCIAKYNSKQSKITVAWYKDGQEISQIVPHLSIVNSSKNSKQKILLKITGFQKVRDQGRYECKARDQNGKVLKSVLVTVQRKT